MYLYYSAVSSPPKKPEIIRIILFRTDKMLIKFGGLIPESAQDATSKPL